jgi:hypothetical protein
MLFKFNESCKPNIMCLITRSKSAVETKHAHSSNPALQWAMATSSPPTPIIILFKPVYKTSYFDWDIAIEWS